MKVQIKVNIPAIRKKVSGQGNEYYTIDIIEKLEQTDETGKPIAREWNNMYYSPQNKEQDVLSFNNSSAFVTINFYPVSRKVGDNIYNDIKAAIVNISEFEETA